MTLDLKAILTRANEALSVYIPTAPGLIFRTLVPQLAADVRELVGKVGILQVDLEAQEKINLRDHERAEKAEARVKELEAANRAFRELTLKDRESAARIEALEASLKTATGVLEYIADIRGQIIASSHDVARSALAKIRGPNELG